MRIPTQGGQGFRLIPATRSDGIRPRIPIEGGQGHLGSVVVAG